MALIMGHILLIVGVYVTAWGLSLPPESSKKRRLYRFSGLFSGDCFVLQHRVAGITEHCF